MYRRKSQKTSNGGVNWWPLSTLDDGIGFGQLITHNGLAVGEALMRPGTSKRWRTGQKPEKLCESVLGLVSQPGQLVVDIFAGTGSFLAAALKMGRHAIGVELDRELVEKVTRPRLKAMTDAGIADKLTAAVAKEYHLVYETEVIKTLTRKSGLAYRTIGRCIFGPKNS